MYQARALARSLHPLRLNEVDFHHGEAMRSVGIEWEHEDLAAKRPRSVSALWSLAVALIMALGAGQALAQDTGPPALQEGADAPRAGREWALDRLATMTVREKAAQLMMPIVIGGFSPVGSPEYERLREAVEDFKVGGVIVSVGSPTEVAAKLNHLQSLADVPLLVGSDLENGAGFRFDGTVHVPGAVDLGGATTFPSLMAIGATGDPAYAYEVGRITGLEARALGVHLPFAPVLDINNNPDNPIINVRSFGEDPAAVEAMGALFVRGLQESGTVATGKHFPGHGDTDTDSHLALPLIDVTRERLDSMELRPFRAAIAEGMGAIMTAHILVPGLTGAERLPATLSHQVLTDLLRTEMGFEGLIVTDAMDMFAIDRTYGRGEAAVRALEAGADIILMPPSVERAIAGIEQAVASGRLSIERLDESALRVLRVKESMGLERRRTVDIASVPRVVGIPEHTALGQEIADRSITLLRNSGDLLPLRGTPTARVLSVSYRRSSDILAGRAFNAELRQTYRRLRSENVDRDIDPRVYEKLLAEARRSDLVIVSTYVTAISFSGEIAIPEELSAFIQRLAAENITHVVVSFGNPYLVSEFPDVRAYVAAWGGARSSQLAAAKALLGQIAITGRTPTRIPPFFDLGDGIQLPARGSR